MSLPLPPHAYVPGQTPRHDDAVFAALHDTVREGMTVCELVQTDAWHAGLLYLEKGYFWEAHEMWEPIWMRTRVGSPERELVQGLIQLANAHLKARMNRPKAVTRLCDIAEAHLKWGAPAAGVMGVELELVQAGLSDLRVQRGTPDMQ